ncbi:MAG: protein translocase subunit SecD [Gemmatimonadota bacterium]
MSRSVRNRLLVILGLIVLCVVSLWPDRGEDGQLIWPLNLGLDLQGGMHLAVEIDDPDGTLADDARADAIDRTLTTIRNRIDEFGVREPTIQKVGDERIIVELAGIEDPDRAKKIVERSAFLEFVVVTNGQSFRDALPRIDRAIVAAIGAENLAPVRVTPEPTELSEILGTGTDTVGAATDTAAAPADTGPPPAEAGPTSPRAEEDTAAVPFGGAEPGALRPLTSLLLESGTPGVFLIAERDVPTVEGYLELEAVRSLIPRSRQLRWGVEPIGQGGETYRELYVLEAEPLVTGEFLADAGPATRDPTFNQPIVPFEMTRRGARIFERGTSRHVGDQMAIVLDGRVQSAPVIRSTLSRRAQIELGAGASFQEAQDLALVLRAGALPQPIKIVEERNIGPSLGADSIRQGKRAFALGVVFVLGLMIAYYRAAGTMAVVALIVYVLLVLGGLAGLGATLTLPGIAGLILSVGMAVDANVLIFERIREEIEVGKTARTAVDAGFEQALSAIVDANLTTLITAAILFNFGTGPVKGFAVTLSIGIVASFFTALFVTKTFFLMYLERRAPSDPVSI